jgi:hypothetical protein
LSGRFDEAGGRRGLTERSTLGKLLIVILMLGGVLCVAAALEKAPKWVRHSHKRVGIVTGVEPTRVSLVGIDGHILTFITKEDFTLKVAIGSQVTVWYTPREGANYLDWMEYPLENFFGPVNDVRTGIKKIILLPSSSVTGGEGIFDAIANYLVTNLGWYVAPRALAEEIRSQSGAGKPLLQAIDPASDKFDMDSYLQSQRDFIPQLAAEARVDAVLEVNIEKVQAEFAQSIAAWDGVTEVVGSKLARVSTAVTGLPVRGEVPATTVVMRLWSPYGKLLWSNRRGFAALYIWVGGGKFKERPLSEVYQNTAGMQSWLALALGNMAPPKNSLSDLDARGRRKPVKR